MSRLPYRGFGGPVAPRAGDLRCPRRPAVVVGASPGVRALACGEIERIFGAIDGQAEEIRDAD